MRNLQSIPVRRLTALAVLSAVGIALHVLESFFPAPLPFLRIGLANISTLVALMVFTPGEMLLVLSTRLFVGSMLIGSLFTPSFLIAVVSGFAAAGAMVAAKWVTGTLFSIIGLSLVGSVTHVVTQLGVVTFLFVRNQSAFLLLPYLLLTGIIGGLVVGFVSVRVLPAIRKNL